MNRVFCSILFCCCAQIILAQMNHLKLDSLNRNVSLKQLKNNSLQSENIILLYGVIDFETEKTDSIFSTELMEFDSLNVNVILKLEQPFFLLENEMFFVALFQLNESKYIETTINSFKESFEEYAIYPRALLKSKINYGLKNADLLDIYLYTEEELREIKAIPFKGKNFLNRTAYYLFLNLQ